MDFNNYFGIAIKRKNDNILVITPDGYTRTIVNESVLNSHQIYLGDCFKFRFFNGIPTSFRKVYEKYGFGTEFVAVGDSVVIENIPGYLQRIENNSSVFFVVNKFSYVAYFGEERQLAERGLNIGSMCRLRMRLMDEDEKTGYFTGLTWCGTLYESPSIKPTPTAPNKLQPATSTSVVSIEPECDPIIGIVIGGFQHKKYVWVKQAYPGRHCSIVSTQNVNVSNLTVGTWVELNLSKKEIDKYFPTPPSSISPRLETHKFRVTSSKFPTRPCFPGLIVNIPDMNVQSTDGSGDVTHPVFGVLNDKMNKIDIVPGVYDVTIVNAPTAETTRSGNLTIWSIQEAILKRESPKRMSRIDQNKTDGKGWSHAKSKSRPRNVEPVPEPSKENPKVTSGTQKHVRSNSVHSRKVVNETPIIVQNPNLGVKKNYERQKSNSLTRQGENQPPAQDWNHRNHDNKFGNHNNELVMKRAMITAIVQNKFNISGCTCELWRIDDHRLSIYHTIKAYPKLQPGWIFDFQFAQLDNSFNCVSHKKPVKADFNMKVWSLRNLEIFEKIYDRKFLSIPHPQLGLLVDANNLIPNDCSKGVRVGLINREWEGKSVWIVNRLVDVKTVLIESFREAWAIKLLVKTVHTLSVDKIEKLEHFYEAQR